MQPFYPLGPGKCPPIPLENPPLIRRQRKSKSVDPEIKLNSLLVSPGAEESENWLIH